MAGRAVIAAAARRTERSTAESPTRAKGWSPITNPYDQLRARRWADFRRRADYAPQDVYRHRDSGWEYIPVHPFADEPDVLDRLGLQATGCRLADAWWGIDGDATLLQSYAGGRPAELSVRPAAEYFGGVYLVARLDVPCVTRVAFEETMARFAHAGFPKAVWLRLQAGDRPLVVDAR